MALYSKLYLTMLLLATVAWQQAAANAGCVSDWCFCFPEGDVECAEAFLTRVPRFNSDNNVTYSYIDLSLNRIRKISSRSFRNIRVRMIKIWENRVALSFDGRAFKGLEDTLQVLTIRKNRLYELPSGLLKDLRRLNKVDFSDNRISTINRGVFRGATSVETLNLEENRLASLGEHVFAGLSNLKTLQLTRNRLTFIDTKALSALTKLETLDLRSNKLRDLQPRAFSRLVNLRRLDLSSNHLPALFPQMFHGLRRLETLILSRNAIAFIARDSFTGMSNLHELVIGKNKLTYLKPGAFDGLDNLRTLILNDNSISDLPDSLFAGLTSLSKIQLDYNQLTTINACAFDNATAVGELLLAGNPLHCDCAVAWTSLADKFGGAANVHGKCKTPVVASGQDVWKGDKYHVCRNVGIEHCKLSTTKNGNASSSNKSRPNDVNQVESQRYKRYGG